MSENHENSLKISAKALIIAKKANCFGWVSSNRSLSVDAFRNFFKWPDIKNVVFFQRFL